MAAVDRAILKDSIKAVSAEFSAEGRKWTADRRSEAKARYQAALDKWNAEREKRNDTHPKDGKGRDYYFEQRQAGDMGPPVPKFKDFPWVTWEDKMKAEVADERRKSPASGKKLGAPLMPPTHPLAGKEMDRFISERRDKITDARIRELIGRIEKRYQADKAAAASRATEGEPGGASAAGNQP